MSGLLLLGGYGYGGKGLWLIIINIGGVALEADEDLLVGGRGAQLDDGADGGDALHGVALFGAGVLPGVLQEAPHRLDGGDLGGVGGFRVFEDTGEGLDDLPRIQAHLAHPLGELLDTDEIVCRLRLGGLRRL
jgi:hypothetical protein